MQKCTIWRLVFSKKKKINKKVKKKHKRQNKKDFSLKQDVFIFFLLHFNVS